VYCIDVFKYRQYEFKKKMKKSSKRSKGWGGARPNTGPKPVDGTGYDSHLPPIRATSEQLARWKKAADKAGLPFSVWVRELLDNAS
jgi:hypothetical protein